MRVIAIRHPAGYRSIRLEKGFHDFEEFEATYAMPAIVHDLIRSGDVIEISGPFTEMSFSAAPAREYHDLESLMTGLDDESSTISIYDAVGCLEDDVAGWNLLASDDASLETERNEDGPWRHMKVGRTKDALLAA